MKRQEFSPFILKDIVILFFSFLISCNYSNTTSIESLGDDKDSDQVPDYSESINNKKIYTQTVLFIYDNPAKEAALLNSGSLQAHSQKLVDEANEIYKNSGIVVRLAISHIMEVDMDILNSLGEMTEANFLSKHVVPVNDGVLDEIHKWRDMYNADLVVIKVDRCGGRAAAIGAEEDRAFAFVGYMSDTISCNWYPYVLAHELGHLQGAGHQDSLSTNRVFPYGYAYGNENWNTVMYSGYGENRIPCFSGKGIYYNGIETGDDKHDNVKAINMTAKKISEFR